jgi:outer membrane protein TolC
MIRKHRGTGGNCPFAPASIFLAGAIFIAILIPERAFAQETGQAGDSVQALRLTPDEAVDLALKHNLSLQSSQVTVGGKKRASDLSWNQFIPSVTAAGSLIRDNEVTTVSGMVPALDLAPFFGGLLPAGQIYGVAPYSVDAPQWHVAGTIQAQLGINLAMFEAMNTLKLDYQSGLISYEKAKSQLERDVRKAYYSMLLLEEQINLLRESYDNADRRVRMAQDNYNAGLAPELTLLQAQVARENMKPAIDQAENGYKLSLASFAIQLGLPYETQFELVPVSDDISFIPLDTADLISKAASGRPDILELKQTILTLKSSRKARVFSLTPSLGLSWNFTDAFIQDPWKDDWGNKDYWNKSGSLTIALSWRLDSLIPWSTGFQAIKSVDDNLRAANIGLAQAVRGTEIEVYNKVLDLERIRTTSEAQSMTVSLAEKSYQLTEQAYGAGLQDLLSVQNAELSLRQARVQALEQDFNYLTGLIDLEYTIGVPFGTLSEGTK